MSQNLVRKDHTYIPKCNTFLYCRAYGLLLVKCYEQELHTIDTAQLIYDYSNFTKKQDKKTLTPLITILFRLTLTEDPQSHHRVATIFFGVNMETNYILPKEII